MYLVTLGVKSHLKKGDWGFACSQDIHDDHIRFFQMVQFPSDLIVHLPGARCVPVFLTRIEEAITSVHPGEPVIQFQLPVLPDDIGMPYTEKD